MEDLFESAKRAASNAVERAAWEADKLRRVSERQKELELTRRERAAMMEQLVATVRDLEARGQITQPQLKSLAERLATLERDLANGQSDIQAIKNETYKPGSVSITVQRKDASQAVFRWWNVPLSHLRTSRAFERGVLLGLWRAPALTLR